MNNLQNLLVSNNDIKHSIAHDPNHIKFMAYSLELAMRGRPGEYPLSACVVVQNGEIINQHWQTPLSSQDPLTDVLNDQTVDITGSDLYLTMEPMPYKNNPLRLLQSIQIREISKLIIASEYCIPQHAGEVIDYLKANNVPVITGVLCKKAMSLNTFFILSKLQHRPKVKWINCDSTHNPPTQADLFHLSMSIQLLLHQSAAILISDDCLASSTFGIALTDVIRESSRSYTSDQAESKAAQHLFLQLNSKEHGFSFRVGHTDTRRTTDLMIQIGESKNFPELLQKLHQAYFMELIVITSQPINIQLVDDYLTLESLLKNGVAVQFGKL